MSGARAMPRSVVIAGGGTLAVLAALAMRRALPATEVTVLVTPPEPAAFADRAGTALPFSTGFLDQLGIEEAEIIARCGGSHRLMTRYIGWGGHDQLGTAAYGAAIDPAMTTGFARDWGGGPRSAGTHAPPGSLGEVLAEAGHFAPIGGDPAHPLAEVEHALRWNAAALRDLAIRQADALGVRHVQGRPSMLQLGETGDAVSLHVEGGSELAGDLFLDCTGPAATLLAQMPGAERIDWSDFLPVRQILYAKAQAPMLALEDRLTLTDAGWRYELAGRDGLQRILGLAPGTQERAMLEALGAEPAGGVSIIPGRTGRSWIGNVIALGDAAALFEPIGGYNADFAHRQLALLIELLPGRTITPQERDEFNRRSGLMADGARDMVAAHYAAAGAQLVFGQTPLSPELALALDQFKRRGRSPFFEEAPLLQQERAALFAALGIERGDGPLSHRHDPDAGRAFAAKAEMALRTLPPYREWMAGVLGTSRDGRPG